LQWRFLGNPNGHALSADGAIIHGNLFFNLNFRAKGEVALPGAKVEGQLNCRGGNFENEGGYALNAIGMTVSGNVLLDQGFNEKSEPVGQPFTATGEVRLEGAKIGGQLNCNGGKFETTTGYAINAAGMTVDYVLLGQSFDKNDNPVGEPFTATGEVSLQRAKIARQLNCRGGKFEKADGRALNADGIAVGDVFLDQGFTAKGEVQLLGARVEGQLNCRGGKFENAGRSALIADNITVGASVFLNQHFNDENKPVGQPFTANGAVRFVGAKISGQLDCRGGKFENAGEVTPKNGSLTALTVFGATIAGALILDRLPAKPIGRVSLGHAKVGQLADDAKSWPEAGKLVLDGFQYGAIDVDSPKDAEGRIKWIELQPEDSFSFQPYEQLAQALRQMGDEAGAREVLIATQGKLREIARLKAGREKDQLNLWTRISNWRFRFANWAFDRIVGYGYRPWLALIWAAAIVVMGWPVFSLAHGSKVLVYAKPVEAVGDPSAQASPAVALPNPHPQPAATPAIAGPPLASSSPNELFHPLLFSLDVFLPAPDLGQKKVWVLKGADWAFYAYETWYIAEGVSGWALPILFTGALSGLIRRE
jgi:hypothetical protein